jgi:hypothetical protein
MRLTKSREAAGRASRHLMSTLDEKGSNDWPLISSAASRIISFSSRNPELSIYTEIVISAIDDLEARFLELHPACKIHSEVCKALYREQRKEEDEQ